MKKITKIVYFLFTLIISFSLLTACGEEKSELIKDAIGDYIEDKVNEFLTDGGNSSVDDLYEFTDNDELSPTMTPTSEPKETSTPEAGSSENSSETPKPTEFNNQNDTPTEIIKTTSTPKPTATSKPTATPVTENAANYRFRNKSLLNQHYEKHGKDMGFASAEEYEKAAAAVVVNPDALHKIESEDGDYVFYVEATNEFVIVSIDGYLRTYFNPDAGIRYYERQ